MLFIGFQPLELSYGQNVEHLLIAKHRVQMLQILKLLKKNLYGKYRYNKIEN